MSALKEIRVKKGLSLSMVSMLTDIPQKTLHLFEDGNTDLTMSKAKKLSVLYGVSIDDIEKMKNQKL
ncbi:helix-turn-helix domain-containing protein [Clostridium cuniculi]|uniref:helix-turn-helix domain-containing protein n=1 Tax=Clostridium cuniculi TaxID=2548455 RepID=UPI001054DC33|nr:helix-turn-helix transcriptional regulator [Clostridium cuniculi]